jgi:hypothetical protein
MREEVHRKIFAVTARMMCVPLLAIRFAAGQTPAPAAGIPPGQPPASTASQTDDQAVPVETTGIDDARRKALLKWQSAEVELKSQVEPTCNPDRVKTLVDRMLAARAPYDVANKGYWIYQKALTDASLKNINEGDAAEEVYPIDDFRKDLADAQKVLADKTKEKSAALTLLETLIAKAAAGGDKKDTDLVGRIDAQRQLIETLDEVIKQSGVDDERKGLILERAQNIIAEKSTLKEKWKLIGELADRQIKGADDEALAARQGISLYRTRHLSSCLTKSQAQPVRP